MRSTDPGADMTPQRGGVHTQVVMDRPAHEHGQRRRHEQQHGRGVADGEAGLHPMPVDGEDEPTGVESGNQDEDHRHE